MTTALAAKPAPGLLENHLERLRCPVRGVPLRRDGTALAGVDGRRRYDVLGGIPRFCPDPQRPESRSQQAHYDRIAGTYARNLAYPHTEGYMESLDAALLEAVQPGPLGVVGEICCGRGEALRLLARHRGADFAGGIGVDISAAMLESARRDAPPGVLFVQGDATRLPLADGALDAVFMLGGIHHVNDRAALFGEIARVLAPGGRLTWREPVDDCFAWRWLRALVYRASPTLDAATEHPLRRAPTLAALRAAGLEPALRRPCGLLGFCLFMNSDVLVVNRGLRLVPGVRRLARAAARLDEALLRLPGLHGAGLQVVGTALKPKPGGRATGPGGRGGVCPRPPS